MNLILNGANDNVIPSIISTDCALTGDLNSNFFRIIAVKTNREFFAKISPRHFLRPARKKKTRQIK